MISGILLSAGLSSRFGSPKALAKLNEGTVIEHLQKRILSAGVFEIVIVLGANAQEIKPYLLKHEQIKIVYNKDYNLGQTSSFKAGLKEISPGAAGFMLWPVDYPLIKTETADQLRSYFLKNKPEILIPAFNGQRGHPPVFHARLKDEFLKLADSVGINTVAHARSNNVVELPVDDEFILRSFNTREEFDALKKFLQ